MKFSRVERALLIFSLLTALSFLLVWGGIDRPPAPELGDYPGTKEIAQHPDEYQNQQVSFVGHVVATNPVVVRTEYGTNEGISSIKVKITDFETVVQEGDRLQVFGVLTDSETVRATNIVVVPRSGLWYAWVTSAIAGLWVLGRIMKHWEITVRTGAFRPRSAPLRLFYWRDD